MMRSDRSKCISLLVLYKADIISVIALSKLYGLNDARVVQTMVKGDLIVPTSDRIMTRSKAKLSMYFVLILSGPTTDNY